MRSVLVVDDLPEVRRQIALQLRPVGLPVVEAGDGREAMDRIAQGPVGVVVSDLRMPRMGGLDLLRALRGSGTPVILHSGYADVEAAVEGLRLGAVDFLGAPLDYERLRRRVAHCLWHLDAVSEQLAGQSREIEAIRRQIASIADSPEPVLITGETGVGKEVAARAIHAASRRRDGPFVVVNVCALADGLLERRAGRFEQAQGGTLLLDEIGDASPRVQAELLRVVETRRFERVGSSSPSDVEVRILAATHRDLPVEVARGRFREDLWYRLIALRIHLPPLRERRADVAHLAALELAQCSEERGGTPFELDERGYTRLRTRLWPGNVRELRGVVRRMAVLAGDRRLLDGEDVQQALLLGSSGAEPDEYTVSPPASSRAEFDAREREETLAVLEAHRGNVSLAARTLGISRAALRNRLLRLGLSEDSGSVGRG